MFNLLNKILFTLKWWLLREQVLFFNSCPHGSIDKIGECENLRVRPDFTLKFVHVLAFGKPKFYIAPYDKIKHELVNLSSNCDVKAGLSIPIHLKYSLL